jgi:hypothetical protein
MNDFINFYLLGSLTTLSNNSTSDITQTNDTILLYVQICLLVVQILTFLCLIVYVIKTWEIASATRDASIISEKTLQEMKETREQENAPYVIVYIKNPIPYDTDLYLIVKNTGKSIAEDVKLDFTPRLRSSSELNSDFNIDNLTFIKGGIKSMPPDYVITTYLGGAADYFEHGEFPLIYNVKISYINSLSKTKIETYQTIDLSAMKDLQFVFKKDIHDLVGKMDDITKAIKDLQRQC